MGKKKPARTAKGKRVSAVQVDITIPDSGLELKVRSDKLMGTLLIDREGVRFCPPNAKVRPAGKIRWETLKALSLAGLE